MCFNNLILISSTTNTVKATLRAKWSPLTISQTRPTIEYSKQDRIAPKHKHVNLTRLPTGATSPIRRLKLNRRKICKDGYQQPHSTTQTSNSENHKKDKEEEYH